MLVFLFLSMPLILLHGQKGDASIRALLKKNTNPPPYPVRTMAEWEESQALAITWAGHHELLTAIIRHAIEEVNVIIITNDIEATQDYLLNAGIDLSRIFFVNHAFNSIWIRDYGPWSVYANDVEDLSLVDWIYNRPERLHDNIIPEQIATTFDWPFFGATEQPLDLIHAGGNHLEDGLGTAFSSDLIQLENPTKTEEEIDNIAFEFLGTKRYYKLARLPYDVIHHLDMSMRFVDEETLLVGSYPEGVADGPFIEANVQYIKNNLTTPFGNPYKIVRIPMPPDANGQYPDSPGSPYRTYTNSLIINKTILVPTYEETYDSTALRIYRELFPGYQIVGIDCNEIIESVGAIHCVTKLIGSEDPLLIALPKLRDTYRTTGSYPVEAIIKHKTGIAGATLYYRLKGASTFNAVPMLNIDEAKGQFKAAIPASPAGSTIEYYIKATAHSGKVQYRPMVAPEGFFTFAVKATSALPQAIIQQDKTTICKETYVRFRGSYSRQAKSFYWAFPGGNPTTSTTTDPIVYYQTAGNFAVQLIVENELGRDTLLLPNAIRKKDFHQPDNISEASWEVINPDEGSNYWQPVLIAGCNDAFHAFKMNNFAPNYAYQRDYLSKGIDLKRYKNTLLTFDIAYTSKPNQTTPDELRINVISCDGDKTCIYDKSGSTLQTHYPTSLPFIPGPCSDWRTETIDLSAYDGAEITIEFEQISGNGNNLYLHNISIRGDKTPNKLPNILLTSPKKDQIITTNEFPYTYIIQAVASDFDGEVKRVQIAINGDTLYSLNEAPFRVEHHFPEYGVYSIQAIAYDNEGGIKYSKIKTITFEVDKIPLETHLEVYPIPTSKALTLHLFSNKKNLPEYHLWTLQGELLHSEKWTVQKGENIKQFPLNDIPSGIYLITLTTPEWTIIKRVTIVN